MAYPTPLGVSAPTTRGKAQRGGHRLGRHLQFQTALRHHIAEEGPLYIRQHHGKKAYTISIPSEKYAKEADISA
jgi:hypothetical protein